MRSFMQSEKVFPPLTRHDRLRTGNTLLAILLAMLPEGLLQTDPLPSIGLPGRSLKKFASLSCPFGLSRLSRLFG